MSKKEDPALKLIAAESKLPDWLHRGTNTLFIVLSWPCILVGFIYLVAFLLLNSSQGPKILHSQLSNFLRGDYSAETMQTDALLKQLTMTNVVLSEAGSDRHVIFAPKVEAEIPLWTLGELRNNTLKVGTITVYDGDVYLDFTRGELNILKVVLPYFGRPDYENEVNPPPVDPNATPFSVWLADLNVTRTNVHLVFDGFRIDLNDTDVEKYEIRAGGGSLSMTSPERGEGVQSAIRVKTGALDFNPALFSFSLSSVGDADEGLVLSGGPGSAGKLGYAYEQMAIHLSDMINSSSTATCNRLEDDIETCKTNLKSKACTTKSLEELRQSREFLCSHEDRRNHFIIPLQNTEVDGFNWRGNTFRIPRMKSDIGDNGFMKMDSAMMNVGPIQEEMDAHESEYGIKLSGGQPQETILWAANVDLNLPVSDHILAYFFGPILKGEKLLNLRAQMAGDLGRASGDIALDMPEFNTFNVDINQAALRARMDGQYLDIKNFEADTALGAAFVHGNYAIMDGDFNIDLWAGSNPKESYTFVLNDFGDKLSKGMRPIEYFDDAAMKKFAGTFSSHLNAQSKEGIISVNMPQPIKYDLDVPLADISHIRISPESSSDSCILSMHHGVLESPGGLNISTGNDQIVVKSGLRFNTNNIFDSDGSISAKIEQPANYLSYLGVDGIRMNDIDLDLTYSASDRKKVNGGLYFNTSNVSYKGLKFDSIKVDLPIKDSVIKTDSAHHISIKSNLFTLQADANVDINEGVRKGFSSSVIDNLPFDVSLTLSEFDLEKLQEIDFDGIIATGNPSSEKLNERTQVIQDALITANDALIATNLSSQPIRNTGDLNSLIQDLGLKGTGEATLTAKGTLKDPTARLSYNMNDVEVMEVPISRMMLMARYEDNKAQIPVFNLWFDPSELTEESTRRNGSRNRRPRRTPDFSLGALSYDIKSNVVQFNVALQPISPNKFKPFRDLGLPVEGKVSLDISSNIDLNLLNALDKKNFNNNKALKATWIEGNIRLDDLVYDTLPLGNTELLFSRSNQYALFKGTLIDLLDLSGFVRTYPRLTVSTSITFPDLDLLDTLKSLGINIDNTINQFALNEAKLSGSLGFCIKDPNNMTASLIIDDISFDVLGNKLTLTQPAFASYNINQGTAFLRQFELKYRDSILKLNGQYSLDGKLEFGINGEIDAAIAKSALSTLQLSTVGTELEEIQEEEDENTGAYQTVSQSGMSDDKEISLSINEASGLLGISLTAKGSLNTSDGMLPDIDINGYLGIRNPIHIKTNIASSPFELKKGFLIFGNEDTRCNDSRLCIYTPKDQPFEFGVNGEWVDLSLFANSKGNFDVLLNGTINASAAQLFVKDISSADGTLSLEVEAKGSNFPLHDKERFRNFDLLGHTKISGKLSVDTPIHIEMRSLPDPISLEKGNLYITQGELCGNGKQCIIIPQEEAFSGNLMGGNYKIYGNIFRENFTPKNGSLSLFANNVSFRMKDELFVTVSPDIMVSAKDFTNWDTVKISGDIDIAEARYKKDFDDGSSNFIKEQILSMFISSKKRVDTYSPSFLRKWPFLGKINLDLGLTAENSINVDVKIATALVNLELGSQLRIGGTIKDFAPSGIFSIPEGVFSLQDNEFEFQNGAQIAFSGSLDGKIDITATTEINTDSNAFSAVTGNTDRDRRKRISSNNSTGSDLYAITLTVGGTIFKPVWSFESSPYLTDTNVYALILTGKTIEDFSGNDVAMESLLSPLFTSQLDTFINADEFNFVLSEGAAQFVYVKQISKALRVAAGVSIRGSEGNEQALSAEYIIHDWDKKRLYLDLTGQNTSDEEGRAPTFKLGATLHFHLPLD